MRWRRRYHLLTPLVTPAVADALLAVAWIVLVLDGVYQTRREHAARAVLGPVVVRAWQPSVAAGVAVLAITLGGATVLERLTGRLAFRTGAAVAGLVLVAAGVALHAWARRTLGAMWSGVIQVRAQHALVERGPYTFVRHPIYLAGLLLAGGTFLAHPSAASGCLAGGFSVGLLLKARLEERALHEALGHRYAEYAARVPALLPSPARLRARARTPPPA